MIRTEEPSDVDAIRAVNRLAFGRDDEARLVDALRAGGHARASFVAEEKGGRVVAHILFSESPIVTEEGTVEALALGQHVKLVKFRGEFVRHKHDHEDELSLVVKGRFRMEFRDRHVQLEDGEFLIVPRGVEHRPVAEEEVHVLLFEPPSDEQAEVATMFPAIARYVRGFGFIEIGEQEGFGFVVRAQGCGGLDFEGQGPDTLAEAMAVLEAGLARWFEEQGVDLE